MTLARDSQLEVLRRAQALAEKLTATPETAVKRSAFLSLVADFMARPEAEPARLRELLRLLVEKRSGGHLLRGKTYAPQIQHAAESLAAEIDRGDFSAQELRSLFGWTARLLEVRHSGKRPLQENESSGGKTPVGPKPNQKRPEPGRKPSGTGLGTLGDKLGPLLNSLKKTGDSK